jgi:hypothetical protein
MTDAELQSLLADIRPRPEPAWAARLDARVARGFPETPRRPRAWWPRWRMPAAAAAIACVVIGLIAVGLSTTQNGPQSVGGSSGGGGGVSAGAERSAGTSGGGSAASKAAPPPGPLPQATARPRKVERSADLELGAPRDRISAVADGIVHATESAGGFVASSNVSTGTFAGASFTLRVPAGRLGRTISAISSLAHVRSLNQSSTDITGVVVSAQARLRDRLAERASLRSRLAHATDSTTAARLRKELDRVEMQVAAARRDLARQRSRASFSTLLVNVGVERKHAAPGAAWSPRDALHDAARVLEVSAGVAVIALAVALPVGLLAAAAWAAVRVGARRRRERALDMA